MGSIPTFSTYKPLIFSGLFFYFLDTFFECAENIQLFGLINVIGLTELPYKKARIVNGTKGPYVRYYAWHAEKQSLHECKAYLSKDTPAKNVKKALSDLFREINEMLENGYHINPSLAKIRDTEKQIIEHSGTATITKILDLLVQEKHDSLSRKNVSSHYPKVIETRVKKIKFALASSVKAKLHLGAN